MSERTLANNPLDLMRFDKSETVPLARLLYSFVVKSLRKRQLVDSMSLKSPHVQPPYLRC